MEIYGPMMTYGPMDMFEKMQQRFSEAFAI